MDETAYARPGSLSSLSSKSGTMSGPDKRHGSPRMSLYPSTAFPAGKKRLSMAEGTGPPPSSVAPYLAGSAVAAFCGQRASQKAELLQYLGKHKGAAARLLASSTADTETDVSIISSSTGSGAGYPGANNDAELFSTNRNFCQPSAISSTNSSSDGTAYIARASSMPQGFRSSSPDQAPLQCSARLSQSISPGQQRQMSVTAYLHGQQDLVTTVLDGLPYVSHRGSPVDDTQHLYRQQQQQQQWQGGSTAASLQRPDAVEMPPAAAAAAAAGGGGDRHSALRDVIHHRISEAVAKRSSSPTTAATATAASSSPTRMHDEVSGARHLLIDEGRARRASCDMLSNNNNNSMNVTRQIFAISTGENGRSSSVSPSSKAAALAKRISNAAIYPAAYEDLLHGQCDSNVTDSVSNTCENRGSSAVYDPAVQGKSERLSVGDYSYGQGSTSRCSTMAATAFMHMYDPQSDQQQQQQQLRSDDQIEYGHSSMTAAAAAAAERAAALDAAQGLDGDNSDSSSTESEDDQQQQQQQGQRHARIPKPRTRYNRGWSVASAAAARRRSSIAPAAAATGPSARAAAAAAARRASSMQAGSRESSNSGNSSDGAANLNDLTATGRASVTQGLISRSSDSSGSSSNEEPSSDSVGRLVNRARRSSAAGGLTARQQARQQLLLRLKNRRSSSSERRSSTDDQGGILARSGGSGLRSAAAGNPRTSAAAGSSSARRSGSRSSSSRSASVAVLIAHRAHVKPRVSLTSVTDCAGFNINDAASARMKHNSRLTIVNPGDKCATTGKLSISSRHRTLPLKLRRNSSSSSSRRRISSHSERRSSSDGAGACGNKGGGNSSSGKIARRLSDAIEVFLNPEDNPAHRLTLGHAAAAAIVMGRNSGATPSSSSRDARVRQSSKTAAAAVGVPVRPRRFSVTRKISSFKQQQQQNRESVRDLSDISRTAASTVSAVGSSAVRQKNGADSIAAASDDAAAAAGSQAQEEAKWVASITRRLSGVMLHD